MWLLVPAVIGIALEFVVIATQNFSHPVVPFFALCIAAWSVLVMEFWKRRQARMALLHGMIGYEKEEKTRPSFKVQEIITFLILGY